MLKVADKVRLVNVTEENTEIRLEDLDEMIKEEHTVTVVEEYENVCGYKLENGYWFEESQLELVEDRKEDVKMDKINIRIKYFEGATKLKKISKGNWIDVYASKDVFVKEGERSMIPLGFALELPQGWEGHLAPRSSTFKTWGIIQTNSVGVVDDTYIGDNDQWHMPVYCLEPKHESFISGSRDEQPIFGTWVRKGDKIGQFRIMEVMPELEFEEVDSFGNADRGGFGSTGAK